MSAAAAVQVTDVHKEFGSGTGRRVVLRGVDLTVQPGQYACVMGRSGSGKSTLLNLIGGLLKPTSGSVEVAGTRVSELSEDAAAVFRLGHVGFVFQAFHLLPRLTAWENVAVPLVLQRARRRSKIEQQARSALDGLGLGELADLYPAQLSGGQQQRVAIARALVTGPPLLLADEPTGNLDATSSEDVLEAFSRIRTDHDTTIVVVTHDDGVARSADLRAEMVDGRLSTPQPVT